MKRRDFLKLSGVSAAVFTIHGCLQTEKSAGRKNSPRPNILFCIADDWGWPHAGSYGDRVVKTETFDRVAENGVLFDYAYVSSPSCTPSRGAILTGQYHWRLEENANLWSTLDVEIPVYPLLLERGGYHVGYWRKSWGPGDLKAGGYTDTHPAGTNYKGGFKEFLEARGKGKPFCFWFGASDPHRPYKKGSGRESGMDISKIRLPAFYPDAEEIRSDIADYYFEVERFNRECGKVMKLLEEKGELDNTIVVITGDNGMPFPRCKSNIYDMGVHVPMAIQWPAKIKGGRRVKDFMSLADLAPTFLEIAGVGIPSQMSGRSLLGTLLSTKEGLVDKKRDYIVFGKERHVPAQKVPSLGGYPCRGIRTERYLYIRNFAPERWPAGVASGATHPIGSFADCDDSPTKRYLVDNRNEPKIKPYFELAFAKRPAEELYDISKAPDQIVNVAADPKYAKVRKRLSGMLMAELKKTADPRVVGGGEKFDQYPYRSGYELNKE